MEYVNPAKVQALADARVKAASVVELITETAATIAPLGVDEYWNIIRAVLPIIKHVVTDLPCDWRAGDVSIDVKIEAALDICADILEMCDGIPESGQEFAESVVQKASGIAQSIEATQRVTPRQQQALENMQAACSKWID